MPELVKLEEPKILFGHNQAMEDPRDGLTLFGPLDEGKTYGIRAGVVGTKEAIQRFNQWVMRIQGPISDEGSDFGRPPYPGFEAAFRIPWNGRPVVEIEVQNEELRIKLLLEDKYQRVYQTTEVFSNKIIEAHKQEEEMVDIWFVVIPDEVYQYCRPMSFVESSKRLESNSSLPLGYARTLASQPSLLFPEDNIAAIPYQYKVDFHHQLKARVLKYQIPTQIIRESTIAHGDFVNRFGRPTRDLDDLQSAIAWNLSTATFYKAGGRPWKIAAIRDGVCYVGLTFKQDVRNPDPRSSCCGAQMFLDSGDGLVFRGAVGPWHNPRRGDYHLSARAAKELVELVVDSYKSKWGAPPKELFLHGKVRFNYDEWSGFQSGVDPSTKLVGVRIRDERDFKLFRTAKHPVLRGLAYVRDERTAYLWTKGFIPRLRTYPGREVPKPLLVDVCRGDAPIENVLGDIMALTKLNYNACIHSDGYPVTLKFADAVGEVLTAGPLEEISPLPFSYYI